MFGISKVRFLHLKLCKHNLMHTSSANTASTVLKVRSGVLTFHKATINRGVDLNKDWFQREFLKEQQRKSLQMFGFSIHEICFFVLYHSNTSPGENLFLFFFLIILC